MPKLPPPKPYSVAPGSKADFRETSEKVASRRVNYPTSGLKPKMGPGPFESFAHDIGEQVDPTFLQGMNKKLAESPANLDNLADKLRLVLQGHGQLDKVMNMIEMLIVHARGHLFGQGSESGKMEQEADDGPGPGGVINVLDSLANVTIKENQASIQRLALLASDLHCLLGELGVPVPKLQH